MRSTKRFDETRRRPAKRPNARGAAAAPFPIRFYWEAGALPTDSVMNDLSALLTVDAIDAALAASNKKGLLQLLAAAASRQTGIAAKTIAAALGDREKLGSTGFGGGVAIPHGKIEGLNRVYGYFARLSQPIDFGAVDNLPVDIVFLILSPPDAGADHLKALAGVSRLLRDRDTVAKLRGARSRDAIFALLTGVESLHAA